MGKIIRTSRGKKQDRFGKGKSHRWRSKQPWERGRGTKRKGNPRYKPVFRNGRKVYILRK